MGVALLNALYHLAILFLVFKLGQTAFGRDVGILTACVVGWWPSFLMHSTQLLRDPLSIAAFLVLVLVTASWLSGVYSWSRTIALGVVGGAGAGLLWLVRASMWGLAFSALLLGIALLIVRQVRERRLLIKNTVGAFSVLAFSVIIPICIAPYESPIISKRSETQTAVGAVDDNQQEPKGISAGMALNLEIPPTVPSFWNVPERLNWIRHGFVTEYPGSKSNIDTDVTFNGVEDVVRYIPRALIIGLFAPFPLMWMRAGSGIGTLAQLITAVETLLMYGCLFLAFTGLLRANRNLLTWLLFLIVW